MCRSGTTFPGWKTRERCSTYSGSIVRRSGLPQVGSRGDAPVARVLPRMSPPTTVNPERELRAGFVHQRVRRDGCPLERRSPPVVDLPSTEPLVSGAALRIFTPRGSTISARLQLSAATMLQPRPFLVPRHRGGARSVFNRPMEGRAQPIANDAGLTNLAVQNKLVSWLRRQFPAIASGKS